jgi:hypothetical protein
MLALRHGVIDFWNICHQLHLLVRLGLAPGFIGAHALILGGIPNGHELFCSKSFKMSRPICWFR